MNIKNVNNKKMNTKVMNKKNKAKGNLVKKNLVKKNIIIPLGFIFCLIVVFFGSVIHRKFQNDDWISDGITSGIRYELPSKTKDFNFSEISNKINLFTYEYFKNIKDTTNQESNIFVSPYSLYQSMAMLSFGAQGETKNQILSTLYLTDLEDKKIGEDQYLLNKELYRSDKTSFFTGNSLWLDDSLSLGSNMLENFVAPIENYFRGDVFFKDLAKESTKKEMNHWASNKTKKHIPKISPELNNLDVICLLNAVCFDAKWEKAFDKGNTIEDTFYGTEKNSQVDMMSMTQTNFSTFFTSELQGIRIPYKEDYVMEVLMTSSETKQTIQDFCKNKSGEELKEIFQLFDTKGKDTSINLKLPKFKMDYTDKNVISSLKNLGINDAFTSNADFSEIAESLYINRVLHKTYLEVDEEGTKAFAISLSGGKTSAPRKNEFIVNRPFVFTIREETTNTILFIGSITNL